MKNYDLEVKHRFGNTEAYKEYTKKTADYTNDKKQYVNNGLMSIFEKFAECMNKEHTPDSDEVQGLVEQLKSYITDNYYTCTNKILSGLGQMYVADERFKNNIDSYAIGTARFVLKAIEKYCN